MAIEMVDLPLKMVMSHSYVSLPEGKRAITILVHSNCCYYGKPYMILLSGYHKIYNTLLLSE
jgi:hypothetical protein